uniref:Conserved oligomeric Golgi complex subunit 3 n=1 Tax=Caenorhabditis tropicalis TaxID=1561998 RepID=A0A1I7TKS7_9PELO
MDIDHMRTVEILAAKAATWGLPDAPKEPEKGKDEVELISKALGVAKKLERELVGQQFPPEVSVILSNMKRYRLLEQQIGVSREVFYLVYSSFIHVFKTMKELRDAYESVSSRTCSLHDACDRALAEQTSLSTGSQLIKTNLYYFKQADAIMKKLSVAKLMVTGHSFAAILVSIDECLTFLRAHPEYKESEAYIAKFEQCLSRAMTWVRVAVLADLDACFNDVKDRQAQLEADYEKIGRGGQEEDTFALLYGVFASKAAVVKASINVVEQRFSNVPEFEEMLAECQYVYFSKRHLLLGPILESTLSNLSTTHAESTCRLTRDACTFMLRTCDDEYRLYRQFFVTRTGDDRKASVDGRISPAMSTVTSVFTSAQTPQQVHPFETFSEQMCRALYDMLRPRIVHNPHLETLAELCTMIKVEMIENRCSMQIVATILGDDVNNDPSFAGLNPRAGFVAVMSELVGDIAERIVYRAGMYAQNDIGAYRPAAGDIAYPQMLQMIRKIESEQKEKEQKTVDGKVDITSTTAIDQHCLWYPTVRRTVLCLSKIFPCLDIGVFHSLARDMLFACIESLQTASNAILTTPGPTKGWSKKLDAHLFVVKHLLILREQTAPYRQNVLRCSRSDALNTKDFSIDFTKFTNVLFDSNAKWFELSTNNTLLELITTVPIEMRENEGDSRRVLDQQLRAETFRLAHEASQLMVGTLAEWIDQAEDERLQEGFDLSKNPKLAANVLKDLAAEAYKNVGSKFAEVREAYTLYIGVTETEAILLSPVRKRVIDVFTRVNSFAAKSYDEESRAVAALPNVQQLVLLLNK